MNRPGSASCRAFLFFAFQKLFCCTWRRRFSRVDCAGACDWISIHHVKVFNSQRGSADAMRVGAGENRAIGKIAKVGFVESSHRSLVIDQMMETDEMLTAVEKLDKRVGEARKALTKACDKRDVAIKALTKAAAQIVAAQRTLARTEKRRIAARAEARKAAQQSKDRAPIAV